LPSKPLLPSLIRPVKSRRYSLSSTLARSPTTHCDRPQALGRAPRCISQTSAVIAPN
jgi:hypothetical protein